MKSMKEFEEIANEHFVEQAESHADFYIQSAQKACKMIPEASESDEGQGESDE